MHQTKERFKLIPAVYLILKNNGNYLFSRRLNTGFMDGFLSLPAGHLEPNEDLFTGIIRETKEELGIDLLPENLNLVHTSIRYVDGQNDRIDFYFTAKKWDGKINNIEEDKCSELGWFSLDNKDIIHYVKNVLENVEKEVGYSSEGFDIN